MTFNFPWKIPAGSSIELTSAVGGWDLPSGDLKDYLFFNGLVYTSAAMVTNKVTIVNRDELNTSTAIELYAEDAISNPVNVSQDAFLFKVTYCSLVTIIDDEITRVDDNHNTVGTDTPTYTLTEDINAVTATNYTAGDVVDYTFKFRTSTAI